MEIDDKRYDHRGIYSLRISQGLMLRYVSVWHLNTTLREKINYGGTMRDKRTFC